MPYTVYVLELRGGNFYVGMTQRPIEQRLEEHATGKGAAWTKFHGLETNKPYEVHTYETSQEAQTKESVRTAELCLIWGLDSVRGASYCVLNPSLEEKQAQAQNIAYWLKKDYKSVFEHFSLPLRKMGAVAVAAAAAAAAGHVAGALADSDSEDEVENSSTDDEQVPADVTRQTLAAFKQVNSKLQTSKLPLTGTVFKCYSCGRPGHFAAACPKKLGKATASAARKRQAKRRVVDSDEEEEWSGGDGGGVVGDSDDDGGFDDDDSDADFVERARKRPTTRARPGSAGAKARPTRATSCFRCHGDHSSIACPQRPRRHDASTTHYRPISESFFGED